MAATDVNRRWQAEMAPFFVELPGGRPDLRLHRARRSVPPRRPADRARHSETTVTDASPDPRPRAHGRAAEPAHRDRRRGRTATRAPGSRCSRRQGVPRDPYEKVADAATVHRFTGRRADASPCTSRGTRSTTTPTWPSYAAEQGIALGTINSNVFQDNDYMLGSVTNPDRGGPAQGDRPPARVRRHHGRDRLARPEAVVLRRHQLPGPGRHPGPAGPAGRGAVARPTTGSDRDQRMLLEYKLFEPAFYTTDVPDWGTAYAHCVATGRAGPGGHRHRPPRAGHEHRVHRGGPAAGRPAGRVRLQLPLLRRRRPHGRARPTRSSCSASCTRSCWPTRSARPSGIAFMLDQCHNIEPKIPAVIRSVMNVQEATAKALLVDRDALAPAQRDGDVLGANAVLMDAYNTDVRPLLRELREDMGLDPDPLGGVPPVRLRREGPRRTGRRARPPGGARDMTAPSTTLIARSNRLGADPRNTNYAGGNTSAKGDRDRPGHRRPGGTVVGQGIRRRPRHADRGRAGRAAAGPAARPGRRLPGRRRARTRWSPRSTTACTAGAAPRRRSTPRCTAWSTRPTSTTCTRTPGSRSPPRPTARR